MFRRVADFAREWETERQATLRVLSTLTDASLAQAVTPGRRTIGFLAWHITQALGRTLQQAGLDPEGPTLDDPVPASASAITQTYDRTSAAVGEQVAARWTDDMLEDDVVIFGATWKRGFALDAMIRHQAHHRGQITVLMRQAGLPVPGVYGPSSEEWVAIGMEARP